MNKNLSKELLSCEYREYFVWPLRFSYHNHHHYAITVLNYFIIIYSFIYISWDCYYCFYIHKYFPLAGVNVKCIVLLCLVSIDASVRSLNSWNRSNRSCACRWALRLRVKQMLSWGELNVCKNKVKRIPWTWIISIFLCTVFITCVIGIFLIAVLCLAMQCNSYKKCGGGWTIHAKT